MYARVARYEVPQDRIGDAVESFRVAARGIEELVGLEAGYVLVDEDGKLMTMTVWESRRALEASETRAVIARQTAARAADGEVRSVEVYEVCKRLQPLPELT